MLHIHAWHLWDHLRRQYVCISTSPTCAQSHATWTQPEVMQPCFPIGEHAERRRGEVDPRFKQRFSLLMSLNSAAIFRPSSLRMYSKTKLESGIFCRTLRITFKNLNFRTHWRIRYFFSSQLPSDDCHDMWCAVIACVERLNISTLRQLSIASGDDTNLPREPDKHIRDI